MVMSEIKQEVREFYNQVGWQEVSDGIYQNAAHEDLRPVSRDYIHKCHMRILRHIKPGGKLLLDYHASRVLPGFDPPRPQGQSLVLRETPEPPVLGSTVSQTPGVPATRADALALLGLNADATDPVIRKLVDAVQDVFGMRPRGMWLAERVWEPHLVRPIAQAGIDYVTGAEILSDDPEKLVLQNDLGMTCRQFVVYLGGVVIGRCVEVVRLEPVIQVSDGGFDSQQDYPGNTHTNQSLESRHGLTSSSYAGSLK